jgi:site-specific recombinase XerD
MPYTTTPVSKSSVQVAFRKALKTAGINKKATVHTLRHYAEYRIMPSLLGASM